MPKLRVSNNQNELDVSVIHEFLSKQSTWARGISQDLVERSIKNSLCFGGYVDKQQVAFARVITDKATFANLVDVFVLPEFRGNDFSKLLVENVISHQDLQGLRRFTLVTTAAHSLYGQFGFTAPSKPESMMERFYPDIYKQ